MEPVTMFVDAGTYPIARWGLERMPRTRVHAFAHHDPDSLAGRLRALRHRRPVVVADGFCPGCGGPAPVSEYLSLARQHGGLLVLDDTQALGILGEDADGSAPFGRGGGGSLRWNDLDGSNVIIVASLAKGLGVPMAVLSAPGREVSRFVRNSRTRVHCSPPSAAVIHAAENALDINHRDGDRLRLILARRIAEFRRQAADEGFRLTGGLFPVQTLRGLAGRQAATLHHNLLAAGVRTVLHRGRTDRDAKLSFLISASHSFADIRHAVRALQDAARTLNLERPTWTACETAFARA
jgi:8-amino-7-oxononanoate synthase